MARGWESKSVEEQQSAGRDEVRPSHRPMTSEQRAHSQKRSGLELSRQRVLQQLQTACNPNHRSMLEKALAELDAQLAELGSGS